MKMILTFKNLRNCANLSFFHKGTFGINLEFMNECMNQFNGDYLNRNSILDFDK